MHIFVTLMMLGALAAGWKFRHHDTLRIPILVGGGLVIALCLFLLRPQPSPEQRRVSGLDPALGFGIAQVLASDFPEGGTVLVLQERNVSPMKDAASKRQLKGVRAGLSSGKWRIVTDGPDMASDNREELLFIRDSGYPHGLFPQWLSTAPQAVAIISFIGAPAIAEEQTNAPFEAHPPFYIVPRGHEVPSPFLGPWIAGTLRQKESFSYLSIPKGKSDHQTLFDLRYEFVRHEE